MDKRHVFMFFITKDVLHLFSLSTWYIINIFTYFLSASAFDVRKYVSQIVLIINTSIGRFRGALLHIYTCLNMYTDNFIWLEDNSKETQISRSPSLFYILNYYKICRLKIVFVVQVQYYVFCNIIVCWFAKKMYSGDDISATLSRQLKQINTMRKSVVLKTPSK